MPSLNRVSLIGNLGRDPELRFTAKQIPWLTFSLATTEFHTGAEGIRVNRTEWHRIVVWNRQAEYCAKYLSKGRPVFVEGRLETRSWEDSSGGKHSATQIVAQNIQFLGWREGVTGEKEGTGAIELKHADSVAEAERDSESEPDFEEIPF